MKSNTLIHQEDNADSFSDFWKTFFRKNLLRALFIFFAFYLTGLFVYVLMEKNAEEITVIARNGNANIENVSADFKLILTGTRGTVSEHSLEMPIRQKYFTSLLLEFPTTLNVENGSLSVSTPYGKLTASLQEMKRFAVAMPSVKPSESNQTHGHLTIAANRCRVDLQQFFVPTEPFGGLFRFFFPRPILNWQGDWLVFLMILGWIPILCLFVFSFFVSEEMSYLDPRSLERRMKIVRAVCTLFPAAVCCLLLMNFLSQHFRVDTQKLTEEIKKIYIYQTQLSPAPELLKSFAVTLFSFPFFLMFWYIISSGILQWIRKKPERRLNPAFGVCSVAGIALPFLTTAACTWTFSIPAPFLPIPISFLVLAAVAFYGWSHRIRVLRRVTIYTAAGLSAVFVLTVFLLRLHSESFPPEPLHFNCVYYSVAQTMAGKTPLINVNSLYGCYALFLEPILRLTGYGIFSFVFVMNLLTAASFVFLFLTLRLFLRDRLILALGTFFLLVFVYTCQYYWSIPFRPELLDWMYQQQVYLMRFPLRTIAVYAALFLMLLYFKHRSVKIYYVTFVLVFVAPFWNLDTGIILPIIWYLSLLADEYLNAGQTAFRRNFLVGVLWQSLMFLAFGIAVPLMISGYLYWRSGGVLPDYPALFHFLQSHAVAGYFSLPMEWNNIGIMVLLIYAAGFYYTLHCLACRRNLFLVRCTLVLSLLGFGLFPYYLNRSQAMNIFMTAFPAVMLGLILLDRLGPEFRRDQRVRQPGLGSVAYVLLFAVLLSGVASALEYIPRHKLALETNLPLFQGQNVNYQPILIEISTAYSVAAHRKNVDFVKTHTEPGEAVLILCDNHDAYYYGMSKTKSVLDLPSSTEWSEWSEINRLKEFLLQNKTVKIFVDPNNIPPVTINSSVANEIIGILVKHYRIAATAGTPGTLVLLQAGN